jgi:hypothetical protein
MAQNRTMQQKNLINRQRQAKEAKEWRYLAMSTYVYYRDDAKISHYFKRDDKRAYKYVIYVNKDTKDITFIEREYLPVLQQLFNISIVDYATDLADVKRLEEELLGGILCNSKN